MEISGDLLSFRVSRSATASVIGEVDISKIEVEENPEVKEVSSDPDFGYTHRFQINFDTSTGKLRAPMLFAARSAADYQGWITALRDPEARTGRGDTQDMGEEAEASKYEIVSASIAPEDLPRSVSNIASGPVANPGNLEPFRAAVRDNAQPAIDVFGTFQVRLDGKTYSSIIVGLSRKRRTMYLFKDDEALAKHARAPLNKPSYTQKFELHGGHLIRVAPQPDGRPTWEIFTPARSLWICDVYSPEANAAAVSSSNAQVDDDAKGCSLRTMVYEILNTQTVTFKTYDPVEFKESKLPCLVQMGRHGTLLVKTKFTGSFKEVYVRTVTNAMGAQILAEYSSINSSAPNYCVPLLMPSGERPTSVRDGNDPEDPTRNQTKKVTKDMLESEGILTNDPQLPMYRNFELCFHVKSKEGIRTYMAPAPAVKAQWVTALQAITSDQFQTLPPTEDPNALPDYYAILKVPQNATMKEIRDAYNQHAKEVHPDKNQSPEANAMFTLLTNAKQCLSDESTRAQYDLNYDAIRAITLGHRRPVSFVKSQTMTTDRYGVTHGPSAGALSPADLLKPKTQAKSAIEDKQGYLPSVEDVAARQQIEEANRRAALLEAELAEARAREEQERKEREEAEAQAREMERKRRAEEQAKAEAERKRRAAMDPIDRPLSDEIIQHLQKLRAPIRATKVSKGTLYTSVREVTLSIRKATMPNDDSLVFYGLFWDSKKRAADDWIFICHSIRVINEVDFLPKDLQPRKHLAVSIEPDPLGYFGEGPVTLVFHTEADYKAYMVAISALLDSTCRTALHRTTISGPAKFLDTPAATLM